MEVEYTPPTQSSDGAVSVLMQATRLDVRRVEELFATFDLHPDFPTAGERPVSLTMFGAPGGEHVVDTPGGRRSSRTIETPSTSREVRGIRHRCAKSPAPNIGRHRGSGHQTSLCEVPCPEHRAPGADR